MAFQRVYVLHRSGNWLVVAALIAGAVFLSIGIALAASFVILAGIALPPVWVRSLWAHREGPRRPVTIEGQYTRGVQ